MSDPDVRLRFIEKVTYRGYTLKIARRGDEIRILIYAPDEPLATRIVIDHINNYEAALEAARALITRLLADRGFEDIFEE